MILKVSQECTGKCEQVVIDAHPPADFADMMEIFIDVCHCLGDDDDIFGTIKQAFGNWNEIFSIDFRLRNRVLLCIVIPHESAQAAPHEFRAKLMQEFGAAGGYTSRTSDEDGCVFVNIHVSPPLPARVLSYIIPWLQKEWRWNSNGARKMQTVLKKVQSQNLWD